MKSYYIMSTCKGRRQECVCDDGPTVYISPTQNGNPEKIEKLLFCNIYEAEIKDFDIATIIIVLALINECEPEEIVLDGYDLTDI